MNQILMTRWCINNGKDRDELRVQALRRVKELAELTDKFVIRRSNVLN